MMAACGAFTVSLDTSEAPMLRSATDLLRSFTFTLVFAVVVLWTIAAQAHSWYPWECCSDNDCAPVPREQVNEVTGGWKLPDGRFIPYKQARMSPDGLFHLCEQKWPEKIADRKILCFYAPVGGF
jgi:hypothetical protein